MERFNRPYIAVLVQKFERMLDKEEAGFFDVNDLEDIIDYYLDKNILKKARDTINYALRIHPVSSTILVRKAFLYILLKKNDKALQILSEAEAIDYTDFEIYIGKGNIYSDAEQHDKAVYEYKIALKYADEEYKGEIFSKIGYEYFHLRKYKEAIVHFLNALEYDPHNEDTLFELSYCYELTDKFEESIVYLNKIIDINPYSPEIWFYIASNYEKLEQYDKAIDAYDFVTAIDKTYISAYINKGNILFNNEKYIEAIEIFKESIEFESQNSTTYCYIGECYEKLEDFNSALEYFNKAKEKDIKNSEAWIGSAIVLEELGQSDNAIAHARKALELSPFNSFYFYILGDMLSGKGNLGEAVSAYREVASLNKIHPDIWLDYSEAFARQGDFEKAVEIIMEGIDIQPDNAELYYRLAAYLFKSAKRKEAFTHLQNALEINFNKYTEMLEYQADFADDAEIIQMIESYRNKFVS